MGFCSNFNLFTYLHVNFSNYMDYPGSTIIFIGAAEEEEFAAKSSHAHAASAAWCAAATCIMFPFLGVEVESMQVIQTPCN
jgi:hypothetical protein